MVRLRRSNCAAPGIARRRRGRGFSYTYPDGRSVSPEDRERIAGLAIPPAWSDVWICRWPNGHIQAVGTDDAGRRQYRYHDDWRVYRDREKFARVVAFAVTLPKLRRRVARDLTAEGLGRERVIAAVVRLLDVGLFRIGGDEYAEEHETFGAASLRHEHVRVREGAIVFDYPAKGSIRRTVTVRDDAVASVVAALRRRSGDNLFAYNDGDRWRDVNATDVNLYLKAIIGDEFTAKDFRTWSATMLAAVALAVSGPVPESRTGRRRAVVEAVKAVAVELGNTPSVCRSAYIDPGVIDRYECGETISVDARSLVGVDEITGCEPSRRRRIERAVIEFLEAAG